MMSGPKDISSVKVSNHVSHEGVVSDFIMFFFSAVDGRTEVHIKDNTIIVGSLEDLIAEIIPANGANGTFTTISALERSDIEKRWSKTGITPCGCRCPRAPIPSISLEVKCTACAEFMKAASVVTETSKKRSKSHFDVFFIRKCKRHMINSFLQTSMSWIPPLSCLLRRSSSLTVMLQEIGEVCLKRISEDSVSFPG
jgi:hypothetical protein